MTGLNTVDVAAKPNERLAQRQNCAKLITLVAAGNQLAFAQLYDSTSRLLFGLLLRILGRSETAQEILERVYAEIWQQANKFDQEREKSLTWLITIAHRQGIARLNEMTDKEFETIRENNANNPLSGGSNSDANISEHQRLVRSAVNALSPAQREVLELSYFSGMNESEIAQYLGHPVETVRLSMGLAMKKLIALFSFLDLQPEHRTKKKLYQNEQRGK